MIQKYKPPQTEPQTDTMQLNVASGLRSMLLFSMKVFFLGILSFGFLSFSLEASTPRTDGPPGSEYGETSSYEGEFQVGFHFGSLIKHNDWDTTSFTLGADIDWRPYDLFGFKLLGLYALQKPRDFIISMFPLMQTEISNLRPYMMFGPSIGYIEMDTESKVKFALSAGVGADVMIFSALGFGLEYVFHSLIGAKDYHFLGARIVAVFP